jgi:hypothetical protein
MVVITQQAASLHEDNDGKRIQRVFTNFLNGFVLITHRFYSFFA